MYISKIVKKGSFWCKKYLLCMYSIHYSYDYITKARAWNTLDSSLHQYLCIYIIYIWQLLYFNRISKLPTHPLMNYQKSHGCFNKYQTSSLFFKILFSRGQVCSESLTRKGFNAWEELLNIWIAKRILSPTFCANI